MIEFLTELKSRDLLAQIVHEEELTEHLSESRTCYVGFDPTADSLHVGHLLPALNLKRWQMAGGKVICLVGGGTGYIGDPTGKTEMRKMLTESHIEENIKNIKKQLASVIDLENPEKGILVNNADWLKSINYLEFLRDFGPHFNVNKMLAAECYKQRMADGLTFLEFNYMLLQSYDFYHLYQNFDCTIQLGGDDQWSNMLGGVALVRKLSQQKAFCITSPLLTNSEGKKMGKTESGAVWLDPNKTSPYDFFQYWRNTADADVVKCLKFMTFVPMEEVDRLATFIGKDINQAKERLAFEVTKIVHGEDEANKCLDQAKSVFAKGSAGADAPVVKISAQKLGNGIDIITLMDLGQIIKTRSEARRLIQQGGLSINGEKVLEIDHQVTPQMLEKEFVLKKGKKKFFKIEIE